MQPREALALMLTGTGLTARFTSGVAVTDGQSIQLGQDVPTVWWINFGGYLPNNAGSFNDSVNFSGPMR